MRVIKLSEEALLDALETVKQGGVVVCPTDTVYGLLAAATNKKAVEKIFKIKKRPESKTLPVFVDSVEMAASLAVFDEKQKEFLEESWPGAKTMILKTKPKIKISKLLIKDNTVALRIPDYKFITDLIFELGNPLAQTSANISGKQTFYGVKEIIDQLSISEVKPDLIIDAGDLPEREASKIIDLTGAKPLTIR